MLDRVHQATLRFDLEEAIGNVNQDKRMSMLEPRPDLLVTREENEPGGSHRQDAGATQLEVNQSEANLAGDIQSRAGSHRQDAGATQLGQTQTGAFQTGNPQVKVRPPGLTTVHVGLGGTGFQPVTQEQLSRRNLPHIQKPGHTYHLIFRTREKHLPEPARRIVLDACLYWNGKKCQVHACVVMPDHVHLLLTPLSQPASEGFHSLSEILHSIKSFSSNQINRLLGWRGPLWLDESYDRYIRSESDFEEKYNYIAGNPAKEGLEDLSQPPTTRVRYPFLYLQWD
jgi:REP element-mobilizing transposase RayT